MKTLTEFQKWGEVPAVKQTATRQFSIEGHPSDTSKLFSLCAFYGMPADNIQVAIESLQRLGFQIRPL